MRQGQVIERCQRRAFAACRHVGRAEVIDDVDARLCRHQPPVAELEGPARIRTMGHCLAVKADDIHLACRDVRLLEQLQHHIRLHVGDLAL